jgi:DNA polymerase elongation subunit (family B)
MEKTFRIFDFNVYNKLVKDSGENNSPNNSGSDEDSIEEKRVYQDNTQFFIQIFGMNEEGKTCSITATGFKPFFYVKVDENWDTALKNAFIEFLKAKMGKFYENSIHSCTLIKRKKLYGFDGGKKYKFLKIDFQNTSAFNKAKNLWYEPYDSSFQGGSRKLLANGLVFAKTSTQLYEAHIPPLLRAFHIKEISPSGWISFPKKKATEIKGSEKKTICDFEFQLTYKDLIALNDVEKPVPFKKCSFDIEASSSHGDFPIPIKTYKKLATNIVDVFQHLENIEKEKENVSAQEKREMLVKVMKYAFGFSKENVFHKVDLVYPIHPPNQIEFEKALEKWLNTPLTKINEEHSEKDVSSIEQYFEKIVKEVNVEYENAGEDSDDDQQMDCVDESKKGSWTKSQPLIKRNTQQQQQTRIQDHIQDLLDDGSLKRDEKIILLNKSLNVCFPKLEGDRVTFIGSTFMRYGETEPYLNHCIVLNSCTKLPLENSIVETYHSEREVLLAWVKLMAKENPDIVIGYNIFGFDYEFLFRRAEENFCVEDFLKLSRNKHEICGTKQKEFDRKGNAKYKIEETSIQIASGQHDLRYIKMTGRLQVDLYNFYRREENLTSYKLDYVSGYFIGDYVKKITSGKNLRDPPEIYSVVGGNLMGLLEGSYVHFEEIGHSVDYYDGGAKFKVVSVNREEGMFEVVGANLAPDFSKKVRWCLAKDDVTPKDIFEMTNGTAEDRAIIAKYCIQDCNLVHYLMNKSDILTGFIEMAKICSVPMSFLVLRGQGIKLTSFIAKKCREKETLVPTIDKGSLNDGYEGAIVLDPKCDLYLDNPVACVDYASLYPSSIISENLSHDSKVWTKEYNLAGNLICETGEKIVGFDESGNPIEVYLYDNLDGYEYVTVEYDTYTYIRKKPGAAAEKVKCGKKVCRFAQFPEGKAIMPSILEELLMARKTTRKLIPQQTDEFMKNVLDKRQLAYKVTANSLYGQCGAKTSSFYEMDVAASTTAIGRLLLTYAKTIIENCYGDSVCETKNYGPVLTKAEYIYGDSVASYTPVYLRIGGKNGFTSILTIEDIAKKYGDGKWIRCGEPGKETKEVCELYGYLIETWTEKGWTKLYRVIRHTLAPHKKMIRVCTGTGLVDITDDHSLLLTDGREISPNECNIGTALLHHKLPPMEEDENLLSFLNKNIEGLDSLLLFKTTVEAAQYCQLLSKKGLSYDITFNKNNYFIGISDNQYEKNPFDGLIRQMEEIPYEGFVYDLTTENHHFAAGIGNLIVHNTDSVFFTFNLQTPGGEPIRGKKALEITIELAQEAGHLASSFLKKPHDLEYEKTFMPFCLLSKKRYVGMLYETDINKGKRKEMGIVLKRRDNAPIVKEVYGGIIDILMKKQNIPEAIDFLNGCLKKLIGGDYPMDKLIITKSLRSDYKNPLAIAHKVLADRMTARDPGNKPGPGDRIPYVYFQHPEANSKSKKILQGDKIETPGFIVENRLKIDYSFYISNQIMKPVQQLFALVLEKIWILQNKVGKASKFKREIEEIYKKGIALEENEDKTEKKVEKLRNKEIKTLLFDPYLRETNNLKEGNQSLLKFFTKKE